MDTKSYPIDGMLLSIDRKPFPVDAMAYPIDAMSPIIDRKPFPVDPMSYSINQISSTIDPKRLTAHRPGHLFASSRKPSDVPANGAESLARATAGGS
jgi:hypothetical protein